MVFFFFSNFGKMSFSLTLKDESIITIFYLKYKLTKNKLNLKYEIKKEL